MRKRGALQYIQSDRTAADHQHTRAGLHFCLAYHGTYPGHNPATDNASPIEWNLTRDRNRSRFRHNRVFGMRGCHRVMMYLAPITFHSRAAVQQKSLGLIRCERLAQDRQVALAIETVPAM